MFSLKTTYNVALLLKIKNKVRVLNNISLGTYINYFTVD